MIFGVTRDFGMLWKQQGFLISIESKNLNGPYVQELLKKKKKNY